MCEVEKVVRGIRRTVGAEQRIRGKRPLLIEDIREMADVAAQVTDEDDKPMPNKRCRDVALLLFLWHSALRRNECAHLLWSDLTFDKRGVVVVIRISKTDQESKSQSIAIPRLDHEYCPVAATERWKSMSQGDGQSPVFRYIGKKDEIEWRVLIDQRIVAIIKHYCAEIGHAFRAAAVKVGCHHRDRRSDVSLSRLSFAGRHVNVTQRPDALPAQLLVVVDLHLSERHSVLEWGYREVKLRWRGWSSNRERTCPALDRPRCWLKLDASVAHANGAAPATRAQCSVMAVGACFNISSSAMRLTESHYTQLPNPALQQQL